MTGKHGVGTGTWGCGDLDTGTWGHRDDETWEQRHGNMGKGVGIQGYGDMEIQRHGGIGMKTQGHEDMGTQGCVNTAPKNRGMGMRVGA